MSNVGVSNENQKSMANGKRANASAYPLPTDVWIFLEISSNFKAVSNIYIFVFTSEDQKFLNVDQVRDNVLDSWVWSGISCS